MKLRKPGRKSSSRRSSHLGKAGQEKKPVGDGINHAVGNLDAAALLGYVIPDVVKLSLGFWCNTVCHQ
jgi:hypothetical protein